MQFSVENVGKLERKLTVRFPADQLESQISARIAEMGRTVRLKGFRPGKVPAAVIQQRFGSQVRGEVLSDLIGSTLREAFEKENLRPVANPSMSASVTSAPDRRATMSRWRAPDSARSASERLRSASVIWRWLLASASRRLVSASWLWVPMQMRQS